MLHYAPDGMVLDDVALGVADWAVAWEGEGFADDGLLLNLLAASRESASRVAGPQPSIDRLAKGAFQPERVAGFCAAG